MSEGESGADGSIANRFICLTEMEGAGMSPMPAIARSSTQLPGRLSAGNGYETSVLHRAALLRPGGEGLSRKRPC